MFREVRANYIDQNWIFRGVGSHSINPSEAILQGAATNLVQRYPQSNLAGYQLMSQAVVLLLQA